MYETLRIISEIVCLKFSLRWKARGGPPIRPLGSQHKKPEPVSSGRDGNALGGLGSGPDGTGRGNVLHPVILGSGPNGNGYRAD